VLGLAFAVGWTPCIGPVLGAILTTSAVSATVSQGMVLLSVYSLGLGLPFLVAAAFTDGLFGRLRILARTGRFLQIGAGGIVVAMGRDNHRSTYGFLVLAARNLSRRREDRVTTPGITLP
jgi:cytochrome c-type biogenesis protein